MRTNCQAGFISGQNNWVAAFGPEEEGGGAAVDGEFEEAGAAPDGEEFVFARFVGEESAKLSNHFSSDEKLHLIWVRDIGAREVSDAVAEMIDVNYPASQ